MNNTIYRVATNDAARVDQLLNSTINRLIPSALALNQGIRVTRTGPGTYTVETARDVSCGYTVYEQSAHEEEADSIEGSTGSLSTPLEEPDVR